MTISNSWFSPIRGNGTASGSGAISRSANTVLPATSLRKPGFRLMASSLDPEQDPPDCEATLDGKWSGVEVTELVHRATLERSIKEVRQRSLGEEPQKPEAYFVWDRDDLVNALQKMLDVKNSRSSAKPSRPTRVMQPPLPSRRDANAKCHRPDRNRWRRVPPEMNTVDKMARRPRRETVQSLVDFRRPRLLARRIFPAVRIDSRMRRFPSGRSSAELDGQSHCRDLARHHRPE